MFQIQVPQTCLPYHVSDNDVPFSYDVELPQTGACLHEGKFYQEEAQWTSTVDPCTMCFCQNGNYKCDTMVCPDIVCPYGRKIKLSGECCLVCSNSSSIEESNPSIPRGCTFGGRFYSAGSRFHPFLIPDGFDMCTECTCDPLSLEMRCTRQENDKLCGKEAKTIKISENYTYVNDLVPDNDNTNNDIITVRPTPVSKSPESILAAGGCKNLYNPSSPYENGSEYHPFIASLGEYKCVTCTCKVSVFKRMFFYNVNNDYNQSNSIQSLTVNYLMLGCRTAVARG